MHGWMQSFPATVSVPLCLSIVLFSGFLVTRLTKVLHLPNVSGYILAGVLLGPHTLGVVPQEMVTQMGFVSDIALSFIAFGVGKFFKRKVLAQTGRRVIVITVMEALGAGVLVTAFMYFVLRQSWDFSLLLGAISTATAPASTMMTIRQYKAKGHFVNTLLQVVALDDVVCLLAFSVATALVNADASGQFSLSDVLLPLAYNVAAIGLGGLCGYGLSRLITNKRSEDNRLILSIAMLLGITALCALCDVSPLLSCMVFSAVYINITEDKKLFKQVDRFTPPVLSLFFILSGMSLDIGTLGSVGLIGVCYFLVRIAGKMFGSYAGAVLTHDEGSVRRYLGLALVPQAGVAIGLAFLGQRLLPDPTGGLFLTIILSSSILYELIGPACAKFALHKAGALNPPVDNALAAEPQTPEPAQPEEKAHKHDSAPWAHGHELVHGHR